MRVTAALIAIFIGGSMAEITTSFWFPNNALGATHITWVASVVDAEQDRMTLALLPTNDPDYEALNLFTNPETYTFASTLFDYSTSELLRAVASTSNPYRLRCEQTSTDTDPTCTAFRPPRLLQGDCRTKRPGPESESVWSSEWTFSNPGTQGVETILRTFAGLSPTPIPDWCTALSDGSGTIPSTVLVKTAKAPKSLLTTYTVIITAGEEKLAAATGGISSVTTSGATGSLTPTTGTGAAAPMITLAPALVGLGAALGILI